MMVLIISRDSFNLNVKSALAWRPNTSGLSLTGIVATYFYHTFNSPLYPKLGILYENLSLTPPAASTGIESNW
jgi:hypothetical protein